MHIYYQAKCNVLVYSAYNLAYLSEDENQSGKFSDPQESYLVQDSTYPKRLIKINQRKLIGHFH